MTSLQGDSPFISEAYRAQQQEMHARPRGYGGKGSRWAQTVSNAIEAHGLTSILDYGCGQNTLIGALRDKGWAGIAMKGYDPAVWGLMQAPTGIWDGVVCTDVLEHVEADKLEAVMDHLTLLTGRWLLLSIGLEECGKTLPDGRNAHITLMPRHVWMDMLTRLFPWRHWSFEIIERPGHADKHLDLTITRLTETPD